jgi:hypothetical protein
METKELAKSIGSVGATAASILLLGHGLYYDAWQSLVAGAVIGWSTAFTLYVKKGNGFVLKLSLQRKGKT